MRNLGKFVLCLAVVISSLLLAISVRNITPTRGREKLAAEILRMYPVEERLLCAVAGHRLAVDVEVVALTVALADVESYGRPSWVRSLKYFYFVARQRALNQLANISLGPAQIKASNIKRITQLDTSQLIELTSDDCANISIAYCFVSELSKNRPLSKTGVIAVAQLYNGQREGISSEGAKQYVDLVSRIYSVVRERLNRLQSSWIISVPDRRHICL